MGLPRGFQRFTYEEQDSAGKRRNQPTTFERDDKPTVYFVMYTFLQGKPTKNSSRVLFKLIIAKGSELIAVKTKNMPTVAFGKRLKEKEAEAVHFSVFFSLLVWTEYRKTAAALQREEEEPHEPPEGNRKKIHGGVFVCVCVLRSVRCSGRRPGRFAAPVPGLRHTWPPRSLYRSVRCTGLVAGSRACRNRVAPACTST